jgi:hypothetical protein
MAGGRSIGNTDGVLAALKPLAGPEAPADPPKWAPSSTPRFSIESGIASNGDQSSVSARNLNMNAILEHAAVELTQNVLETNLTTTNDLTHDHCVALVTGGAVLGFDDRVHIDLDRSHTVLSPDDARQFAAELKRVADLIDPLPQKEGPEFLVSRQPTEPHRWQITHRTCT